MTVGGNGFKVTIRQRFGEEEFCVEAASIDAARDLAIQRRYGVDAYASDPLRPMHTTHTRCVVILEARDGGRAAAMIAGPVTIIASNTPKQSRRVYAAGVQREN